MIARDTTTAILAGTGAMMTGAAAAAAMTTDATTVITTVVVIAGAATTTGEEEEEAAAAAPRLGSAVEAAGRLRRVEAAAIFVTVLYRCTLRMWIVADPGAVTSSCACCAAPIVVRASRSGMPNAKVVVAAAVAAAMRVPHPSRQGDLKAHLLCARVTAPGGFKSKPARCAG